MRRHRLDPVSLSAGLLFTVLGAGFLLRGLDLARFRPAVVGPVLLIGLGLVILVSAAGRSRTVPAAPAPEDANESGTASP